MYKFITPNNAKNLDMEAVRAYNEQVSYFTFPALYGAKTGTEKAGIRHHAKLNIEKIKNSHNLHENVTNM